MDREIIVLGKLDIKGYDLLKRVYSIDGISPTLYTCGGGGNTEVKILDLERFRVRKLTPTEYGRLQAFPMQDWEQVVSDSQAYKQFGNAVTTTVVTAVAQKIKAALDAGISQPSEVKEIEKNTTDMYLQTKLEKQLRNGGTGGVIMTNYELIKNMTIDGIASLLDSSTRACSTGTCNGCPLETCNHAGVCTLDNIKEWLDSEIPLKPCPFCGGEVHINNMNDVEAAYFMIECDTCDAAVCFGNASMDETEAIRTWNRRTQ